MRHLNKIQHRVISKAYNRNGKRITYGHSLALVVLIMATTLMEESLAAVNKLLTDRKYNAYLSLIKGVRNGAV